MFSPALVFGAGRAVPPARENVRHASDIVKVRSDQGVRRWLDMDVGWCGKGVAMGKDHIIVDAAARAGARALERVENGEHDSVDARQVEDLAKLPEAPCVPARGRAEGSIRLFDPVRQAVFLQALKEKPIVGRAAEMAGITVSTAYKLRGRSPAFAAAWDDAVVRGVDGLEEVAMERALEKSDKLMELFLKGLRPERYREKLDVNVDARVEIVVDLVPGDFVEAEAVEVIED